MSYSSDPSFLDPKTYRYDPFFFRFHKKKIEKSFLSDSFYQNLLYLKSSLPIFLLLSLYKFSSDPSYLLIYQGLSSENLRLYIFLALLISLLLYSRKYTILTMIMTRILLEFVMLELKMRILDNYDPKTAFISILSLNLITNELCLSAFFINFCLISISNLIITYQYKLSLHNLFLLLLISNGLSFLFDRNTRKNWIFLDKQRKGLHIYSFLYNNSINPHFIVDQNKRILTMNLRAQEIFDLSQNLNAKPILKATKTILCQENSNSNNTKLNQENSMENSKEIKPFQDSLPKGRNLSKGLSRLDVFYKGISDLLKLLKMSFSRRSSSIRIEMVKSKNFMKLLNPLIRESFEEQLLNAKQFTTSAFSLELVLPRKYSGREDLKLRYTDLEAGLLNELMGADSLFEEFTEDVSSNERSLRNLTNRKNEGSGSSPNMFGGVISNGLNEKLIESNDSNLEMFFNTNIKPILWGNRPCFTLEFKDIINEKDILTNSLKSFEELHENLLVLLTCLENDYVKWNNLQSNVQGAMLIKDGDLKNLANGIYLLNMLINKVCRKKEKIFCFLGDPKKTQQKFHVQNTLIYFIELVFLKNGGENLWEVNFSFEESFPDFVNGDYFRFKTVLLIFLKMVFVYSNFPKHSKFKIHCRLKEIVNTSHNEEGKYLLVFDFDLPRHEKLMQLLQLLLTNPIFHDVSKLKPLFLHPSNVANTKQEFLIFRHLLDHLNCKHYSNDQDPKRFKISFEFSFGIVNHLETLIGLNRSGDNSYSKYSNIQSKSNNFNHKLLNLSFLRSQLKKNNYVWKPKPKKIEKNINPAFMKASKESTKEINPLNKDSINKESISPNKDNIITSLKELAVSNNNFPINSPLLEQKKYEEISSDQIVEVKLKSQQNLIKVEESIISPIRKSVKRRDSKLKFLFPLPQPTFQKLIDPYGSGEELKSDSDNNEQNSNTIAQDYRKSHFSIAMEEANKGIIGLKKFKSRELLAFPEFLNYKVMELREEKKPSLKKMLMKDTLILLKQQVLNQEKKVSTLFKSEMCIPKEFKDFYSLNCSEDNENPTKLIKYNSFSSIEDLKKFDYIGFRNYVFRKCDKEDKNIANLGEFLQKIELKKALDPQSMKLFSILFSDNHKKIYDSLMK